MGRKESNQTNKQTRSNPKRGVVLVDMSYSSFTQEKTGFSHRLLQGFFVFLGAEIRPNSQSNLGDFFPNFEKNAHLRKKYFFFKFGIFIQSPYTHKLHGDNLLPQHLISPLI